MMPNLLKVYLLKEKFCAHSFLIEKKTRLQQGMASTEQQHYETEKTCIWSTIINKEKKTHKYNHHLSKMMPNLLKVYPLLFWKVPFFFICHCIGIEWITKIAVYFINLLYLKHNNTTKLKQPLYWALE